MTANNKSTLINDITITTQQIRNERRIIPWSMDRPLEQDMRHYQMDANLDLHIITAT